MRNLQVAFLLGLIALAALAGANAGRKDPPTDFATLSGRVGEEVLLRGHVIEARVGRTGHTTVVLADEGGNDARVSFPAIVPVLVHDLVEARGRVATGLDGVIVFANVDSLRIIEEASPLTVAELNAQAPRIIGRTVTVAARISSEGDALEDLDGGHRICLRIANDLAAWSATRFVGVIEYRSGNAQYCLKVTAVEGPWIDRAPESPGPSHPAAERNG